MKATYTLDGVRGLQQALERGGQQLKDRVSHALEQTARNVQRSARALAPVREGDLRNAIQYTGKGLNFRVGVDNATISRRGGTPGHQNPSVYGVWYELGFVTKNIASQPFMGPARDAEERPNVDRTEQAINAVIGGMS